VDLARLAADGIVSASADAVVAADRSGVIRLWNPGAERIFGHGAGEAVGQPLDLIIPERGSLGRLAAGHRDRPEPVRRRGSSLGASHPQGRPADLG
jgi:PAS domain S-box-containing protein